MFIYSKNNPVNMSDSDGFRPEFSGTGHDTGDNSAVSFAIMNKRYDYSTGYINKNFDYGASINKGTKSGVIDKVGEVISGALMKDKIKWESLGTMTMGRYIGSIGKGAKIGKGTLGLAGTISFTFWDVGKDLYEGEYYSAKIDLASSIVGAGIGVLIGIGAAALVSSSSPILAIVVVNAAAFTASVGIGVTIDKYTTYRKDVHYGR